MLEGDEERAKNIGEQLTTGYADHSWCITIGEAQELGLQAREIEGEVLDIVWQIHGLNREKDDLIRKQEQAKMREQLKGLPPELLKTMPPGVVGNDPENRDARHSEEA